MHTHITQLHSGTPILRPLNNFFLPLPAHLPPPAIQLHCPILPIGYVDPLFFVACRQQSKQFLLPCFFSLETPSLVGVVDRFRDFESFMYLKKNMID